MNDPAPLAGIGGSVVESGKAPAEQSAQGHGLGLVIIAGGSQLGDQFVAQAAAAQFEDQAGPGGPAAVAQGAHQALAVAPVIKIPQFAGAGQYRFDLCG